MSQNKFIASPEILTPKEWTVLRRLIHSTFLTLSSADGEVTEARREAFSAVIADARGNQAVLDALGDLEPQLYPDPLHRKLLIDIWSAEEEGRERQRDIAAELLTDNSLTYRTVDKAKSILEDNLTSDEFERFVGSVMISLLKIATSDEFTQTHRRVLRHLGRSLGHNAAATARYFEEYEEPAALAEVLDN